MEMIRNNERKRGENGFSQRLYGGGATAANQYEGGYQEDGRGLTVADFFHGRFLIRNRAWWCGRTLLQANKAKTSAFDPKLPEGANACDSNGRITIPVTVQRIFPNGDQ